MSIFGAIEGVESALTGLGEAQAGNGKGTVLQTQEGQACSDTSVCVDVYTET